MTKSLEERLMLEGEGARPDLVTAIHRHVEAMVVNTRIRLPHANARLAIIDAFVGKVLLVNALRILKRAQQERPSQGTSLATVQEVFQEALYSDCECSPEGGHRFDCASAYHRVSP